MTRISRVILCGSFVAFGAVPFAQTPATAPLPGQPPRAMTEEEMARPAPIPEGFTPIFNGKDLTGWHVSRTNHHGTMPDFRVVQGVIAGTQNPAGEGGILLTDRTYRNFEVFMEVKADWGCDSGLFLRSTEAGQAYQVTMDYLPDGAIGGIYGEELQGVGAGRAGGGGRATTQPGANAPRPEAPWTRVWRREEWNTIRARIEGDVPHITVWVNGEQVTDFTDTANHSIGGATEGMIAIQVHRNGVNNGTPYMRWVPGGFWRWRTIAVKPLP
jgi:3-keto-disaccharide hydrolase